MEGRRIGICGTPCIVLTGLRGWVAAATCTSSRHDFIDSIETFDNHNNALDQMKINYSNINLSIDNLSDFIRVKNIIKFCKNKNYGLNYTLLIYKKLFNEK